MTKDQIIAKLQDYHDLMESILNLVSQTTPSSNHSEAQGLLRKLKDELKQDYDSMNMVRNQKSMSELETAFLVPAIRKAKSKIRVKYNSRPNQNWIDQIYEAQGEISFWLNNIGEDQAGGGIR